MPCSLSRRCSEKPSRTVSIVRTSISVAGFQDALCRHSLTRCRERVWPGAQKRATIREMPRANVYLASYT